jgi:hypothetical protein
LVREWKDVVEGDGEALVAQDEVIFGGSELNVLDGKISPLLSV